MQTELHTFYCSDKRTFDTIRYEASIFGEQTDLFEVCASPAYAHMGIKTFEREQYQAPMYASDSDDEVSSIIELDDHVNDMTVSAPTYKKSVFNMPYFDVIRRRSRTA